MKWLEDLIKKKPHLVISVPAILCAITFCTNFYTALSDGFIDANEYSTLLSTADGFESVLLFIAALVLRNKDDK